MTDGLALDVYVEMTAPRIQVRVEEGSGDRLEVLIGAPYPSQNADSSAVHLWFTRPQTVIELGEQLIRSGQTFLDQCRGKASDETARRMELAALLDERRSARPPEAELFPVPQRKAVTTEPVGDGVADA
jgi:hypothetical protein